MKFRDSSEGKDNIKNHVPKLLLKIFISKSLTNVHRKISHMVLPGISDQDEGYKIIGFVYFYNSNNLREYFWAVGVRPSNVSSHKVNLVRGGKFLNRRKCLLKYIDRKKSCRPKSCEPGNHKHP